MPQCKELSRNPTAIPLRSASSESGNLVLSRNRSKPQNPWGREAPKGVPGGGGARARRERNARPKSRGTSGGGGAWSERRANAPTGRPSELPQGQRAPRYLTDVEWKLPANGKITTVLLHRGGRKPTSGL